MEKLIYITFVDYKEKSFLGVIKKIEYQMKTFRKAGMEVSLVGQYGRDAVIVDDSGDKRIVAAGARTPRRVIADAVEEVLERSGADYAYIRFQFFCNNVALMLKRLKKRGVRVIMEIPTYPYEGELRLQGLKGIPKLLCDRAFRGLCSRSIDRFAVSGSESEVYGVPAYTMRNGLCMDEIRLSEFTYSPERLDMLSVSSMMPWHGLERMIRGIADYYAAGGEREVVLHAVGDGKMRQTYESLAEELGVKEKVIFYGALYGDELNDVWNKCCVGLCALSAHIKNMKEGTPLKTVEYISRGMPAVTEMKLWFADESTDFCLRIPSDDTPLDIDSVINFCDRLFGDSYELVKMRIRKTAEEKCDMSASMRPAVEFFRS